jgi:hypothetical protein
VEYETYVVLSIKSKRKCILSDRGCLFIWRLRQISTGWWVALGLLLLLEVVWLIRNWQNPSFKKRVYGAILADYLLVILIATVFSRDVIGESYWNQLVSFDISSAWTRGPGIYGAIDTANELLLNIIMFIPFGYLLARIIAGKIWIVFGGCLLITLSIETLQLLTKRGFFELADILLNMAGAMIGYLVYRI